MHRIKRGDTIVEVTVAITIFSMVAALSISMMNSGVATAQSTMELSMARNEIDSQSEAIRFIHDSYTAKRSLKNAVQEPYKRLWHAMIDTAVDDPTSLPALQTDTCTAAYGTSGSGPVYANNSFVVNTRKITPSILTPAIESPSSLTTTVNNSITAEVNKTVVKADSSSAVFAEAGLYPRIIYSGTAGSVDSGSNSSAEISETTDYNEVARAEGIWVIAAKDKTTNAAGTPKFYDFHIYTCWYAPGRTLPTTIGTIIRLYNPELY